MMKAAGRSKCPGDKRLLGAFLLELDTEERARIAAHVDVCPVCRRKQAVLAEIAEELRGRADALPADIAPEEETALRKMARAEVRKLSRRKGSRHGSGLIPLGATAVVALLVAAAAVSIFFFSRSGRQEADRGDRSGIRLIEPAATLDRAPAYFRWAAVPDADIYRFEIFDEELLPVLERQAKGTSLTLAPGEQASLRPGQLYFCSVEAFDDEGRSLVSGQRSFVIAPGGGTRPPSAPIRTKRAQRRGCP
jgi:hypothetical protein